MHSESQTDLENLFYKQAESEIEISYFCYLYSVCFFSIIIVGLGIVDSRIEILLMSILSKFQVKHFVHIAAKLAFQRNFHGLEKKNETENK